MNEEDNLNKYEIIFTSDFTFNGKRKMWTNIYAMKGEKISMHTLYSICIYVCKYIHINIQICI
jgi:hypothetical protein